MENTAVPFLALRLATPLLALRLALQLAPLCLGMLPWLEASMVRAQTSDTAQLTWTVQVPEDTPKDAELYMAGNVAPLGPWQPDAFRMTRTDSGAFRARLELPMGTSLEYKFTRGSWGTVEKDPEGAEIPNRRWTVAGDAEIKVEIAAWAKPAAPRVNTGRGDLRWRDFPSPRLGGRRRITIWLPPQFQQSDAMRFPVVYLLDGQNVFDASRAAYGAEWQADEVATEFAESYDAMILVAIDNSPERMDEYTPDQHRIEGKLVGGKADAYLRFLCEELKPWIDSQFPTRTEPEHTTLVGSSLGGLMVLHALSQRGDVFGNGIAMSPSLFWADAAALRNAATWTPPEIDRQPLRLWIDMGTREGKSTDEQSELVQQARQLESLLRTRGGDAIRLRLEIAEGAEHHERAWAERLPAAMRFAVLGEQESP